MARNAVLLAAMGEVDAREAGLASGIVRVSFMTGGGSGGWRASPGAGPTRFSPPEPHVALSSPLSAV
jgi:hypothetical protein